MAKTALILGVNGGFGGEVALALAAEGWRLRALTRGIAQTSTLLPGLDTIAGDCMNPDAVLAAAGGADLIVHGVHPAGYRGWDRVCLPMLENSIAAAHASGALVLFPGTVYNYGPDSGPVIDEATQQHPDTALGRIRVAMERRLQAACDEGVRAIVLRAGDFFGPRGNSSWLTQGMITAGKPIRAVTWPGRRGVGHAFAYLPDLARAAVGLVARNAAMAPFEAFHFGGHWLPDGRLFAEAIARLAGGVPIRPLPWPAIGLLAPFSETMRGTWAMRRLWREPLRLENAKLRGVLGEEPHTPLREALATSLIALNCLPAQPSSAPSASAWGLQSSPFAASQESS